MSKLFIGIDPGSVGFIAAQEDGEWKYIALENCDWDEVFNTLKSWRESHREIVCAIEDVHAIYGSSAESTFNFGRICGMLRMILIASRIPYVMVQPKQWQKEMWMNADIVSHTESKPRKDGKVITRTIVETKASSLNAARRLFPGTDFRKDVSAKSRCKKFDDNKIDATLICEYARRKNL